MALSSKTTGTNWHVLATSLYRPTLVHTLPFRSAIQTAKAVHQSAASKPSLLTSVGSACQDATCAMPALPLHLRGAAKLHAGLAEGEQHQEGEQVPPTRGALSSASTGGGPGGVHGYLQGCLAGLPDRFLHPVWAVQGHGAGLGFPGRPPLPLHCFQEPWVTIHPYLCARSPVCNKELIVAT